MRKREAVGHLRKQFEVSERRACRVVGQPRSTERYRRKPNPEGERFRGRVVKLAGENPRYGYRRVTALLRREGWRANAKTLSRIVFAPARRAADRYDHALMPFNRQAFVNHEC